MRLLLLNQFYLPDTAPTGRYLHDLAKALVHRGHQVTVLCSRRAYDGGSQFAPRETIDGVEVIRVAATGFGRRSFIGKLADYTSFYACLFVRLLFGSGRPDLILSLTTPPYIGLLGKIAAWWRRCPHAHWIMDLYPDVMFAHGMTQPRGLLPRLLRGLTRFELRGSSATIALGPIMAERVSAYATTVTSQQIHSLALWSDPKLEPWPDDNPNPLRTQRGWNGEAPFRSPASDLRPPTSDLGSSLVLLYSGNMGLGHRLSEFLEAAKQLGPTGPRWAFSGGGKRRAEVEQFARNNPGARIELLPYVPEAQLQAHLCAADVHLASLDAAWQGLMVPSKLQASFAVAKPVVFVGDAHNETARWIQEAGAGWVVPPDDLNALIGVIKEAADPREREKRGQAALRFARQHFQMGATCVRMAELLEGLKK